MTLFNYFISLLFITVIKSGGLSMYDAGNIWYIYQGQTYWSSTETKARYWSKFIRCYRNQYEVYFSMPHIQVNCWTFKLLNFLICNKSTSKLLTWSIHHTERYIISVNWQDLLSKQTLLDHLSAECKINTLYHLL